MARPHSLGIPPKGINSVRSCRYKYYTNQQTRAQSYTGIADIVFDAGWSKSLFVNERKVKRHAAAIALYVAVGLWRHFRVHRQDQQQDGGENWYHSHFESVKRWKKEYIIIINKYSPKWRWIVMDIYRAAKRRGKYPSLSPTLRWIIVLVYTTQAK